MSDKRLFSDIEIYDVIEEQKAHIKKEVYGLESNYLLNASEDDLVKWLVDRYKLDIPELHDEGIYVAKHEETKVDVSHDPMRWIDDRSSRANASEPVKQIV